MSLLIKSLGNLMSEDAFICAAGQEFVQGSSELQMRSNHDGYVDQGGEAHICGPLNFIQQSRRCR